MTDYERHTERQVRNHRANARAQAGLTVLGVLVTLAIFVGLGFVIYQTQAIRGNQRSIESLLIDSKRQTAQVAEVLTLQKKADISRNEAIDRVIARVQADLRHQIAEHDMRAVQMLGRNKSLLEQEVYAPSSRERTGAATKPFIGPVAPSAATRVAPTCQRLPNGKCRK